jgi:hypothetical protein
MRIYGEPFVLVNGSPSVAVNRGGRRLHVFKKNEVEATPELEAQLQRFAAELEALLGGAPS